MESDTEESLLPQEIIEEILLRLPVKSLLRLRCVSKSCLSLIDSKRFIKTHLQYSTKNTDFAHHRVIFTDSELKQCSLRSLLDEPNTDPSPLDYPMKTSPVLVFVAGCSNGLVCIFKGERFFLFNPSTRISKELPKSPEIENKYPNLYLTKVGFGWDESSDAYKVFAGWTDVSDWPSPLWFGGRVYSSKTNSWKTVEYHDSPITCVVGQFVGGKLHWLTINFKSLKTISAFDLKNEVFRRIELPVHTKVGCGLRLGVVGGCLCLCAVYKPKTAIDVWVMKEYGVRESWEKLATIHLVYEPHGQIGQFVAIIGAGANGEILIVYGSTFLVYYPRDNVLQQRKDVGSVDQAHLYVESLVSPVLEISSLDI